MRPLYFNEILSISFFIYGGYIEEELRLALISEDQKCNQTNPCERKFSNLTEETGTVTQITY